MCFRLLQYDLTIKALIIIILVVSAFFLAFPQVDLKASAFFFDETTTQFKGQLPHWVELRDFGRMINLLSGVMFAVAAAVLLFYQRIQIFFRIPVSALFLSWRNRFLYGIAVLALGVGLLVNGLFKSVWGRARPSQIMEFGGERIFTPAWYVVDQCKSNCSFVSGESASGMWVAIMLIVMFKGLELTFPALKDRLFLGAVVGVTAASWMVLMAFTRLIAGGHFLSDVILGALMTLLVALLLKPILKIN